MSSPNQAMQSVDLNDSNSNPSDLVIGNPTGSSSTPKKRKRDDLQDSNSVSSSNSSESLTEPPKKITKHHEEDEPKGGLMGEKMEQVARRENDADSSPRTRPRHAHTSIFDDGDGDEDVSEHDRQARLSALTQSGRKIQPESFVDTANDIEFDSDVEEEEIYAKRVSSSSYKKRSREGSISVNSRPIIRSRFDQQEFVKDSVQNKIMRETNVYIKPKTSKSKLDISNFLERVNNRQAEIKLVSADQVGLVSGIGTRDDEEEDGEEEVDVEESSDEDESNGEISLEIEGEESDEGEAKPIETSAKPVVINPKRTNKLMIREDDEDGMQPQTNQVSKNQHAPVQLFASDSLQFDEPNELATTNEPPEVSQSLQPYSVDKDSMRSSGTSLQLSTSSTPQHSQPSQSQSKSPYTNDLQLNYPQTLEPALHLTESFSSAEFIPHVTQFSPPLPFSIPVPIEKVKKTTTTATSEPSKTNSDFKTPGTVSNQLSKWLSSGSKVTASPTATTVNTLLTQSEPKQITITTSKDTSQGKSKLNSKDKKSTSLFSFEGIMDENANLPDDITEEFELKRLKKTSKHIDELVQGENNEDKEDMNAETNSLENEEDIDERRMKDIFETGDESINRSLVMKQKVEREAAELKRQKKEIQQKDRARKRREAQLNQEAEDLLHAGNRSQRKLSTQQREEEAESTSFSNSCSSSMAITKPSAFGGAHHDSSSQPIFPITEIDEDELDAAEERYRKKMEEKIHRSKMAKESHRLTDENSQQILQLVERSMTQQSQDSFGSMESPFEDSQDAYSLSGFERTSTIFSASSQEHLSKLKASHKSNTTQLFSSAVLFQRDTSQDGFHSSDGSGQLSRSKSNLSISKG